ncbi:MAG: K(+)-transporting ATPase subunit F [Jatrophihabitans sp.]
MNATNAVGLVLSALVLVFLIIALVLPEKF